MVLAIDPGTTQSGFAWIGTGYRPETFGKKDNSEILTEMIPLAVSKGDVVVIERIDSYGMPVGRQVFRTCEWIGRFAQAANQAGAKVAYVSRMNEKRTLLGKPIGSDSEIRQALIRRFAKTKDGKGTKADPDFFHGFAKDAWQAYAVGVTYLDGRFVCEYD